MASSFKPVIKWTGSKRHQAKEIVDRFPKEIVTYYEPFLGGGSVMRELLDRIDAGEIKVQNIVCSDYDNNLMTLWNEVMNHPIHLADQYFLRWHYLIADATGSERSIAGKSDIYYKIRDRFNEYGDPDDFFFLLRTCFNGMPRYNAASNFNSPYHVGRDGINPDTMRKIIYEWSEILRRHNVVFRTKNYMDVFGRKGDFMYLDPPYKNTKGLYKTMFNDEKFLLWLKRQECGYCLSYNGISGDTDNTADISSELYDEHYYIKSGNSSFKRLTNTDSDAMVYESIYIKNVK